MSDKQSRAETIVASIVQIDAEFGGPFPLGTTVGRITRRENWEIKIYPEQRRSVARGYREKVEQRVIPAPSWRTVEFRLRGREIFVVNLHGDRVDIVHFQPGAWEQRFGSDPGNDTVPYTPFDVAIGPNADAQTEQRKEDLKLPPQRTGPETGDELRNPTMRQNSRSRATDAVRSGYTVALSGRRAPGF